MLASSVVSFITSAHDDITVERPHAYGIARGTQDTLCEFNRYTKSGKNAIAIQHNAPKQKATATSKYEVDVGEHRDLLLVARGHHLGVE